MENDPELFKKIQNEIESRIYNEVEKLVHDITLIIERELKQVIGEKAFAFGDLYKSVGSEVNKLTKEYLMKTFVHTSYAQYVYDGTKPHFPPIEKIYQWVKKKNLAGSYSVKTHKRVNTKGSKMTRNMEDYQIAEKIAWKIYKKGTAGVKFFDIALKQAMPKIKEEVMKHNFDIANVSG